MRKNYKISMQNMLTVMGIFNYINIIFCGSIVLLTTKFIINHRIADEFLLGVSSIPQNPLRVFFLPIILYAILLFLMYIRNHKKEVLQKYNIVYGLLEMGICFFIIYTLYMGYNGIVLLVFADIISHMKETKNTLVFLGILILLFLLSSYDIISIHIPMVSLQDYIGVYDATTRVALIASKNILETLNLIIFIAFMIMYIQNQRQENEDISKELSMIHQVNEELRNYATMTEKIAEDRERKRVAREIHDTLGHALTGIAAGVDACIALIDRDVKQTKEQLFLVSKVVRQGIGDVQGSLKKLRPGALEKHGFKEAIHEMIEEFSKVTGINVNVQYQLEKVDFDKNKEDTLFRIIQESITNAKRHGEATHVEIQIQQIEGFLYLQISDNGKGCKDIQYGFGLQHMQERVDMLQGQFTVESKNGFTIIIKLPMREGENYD